MLTNHVPSYETCLKLKEVGFEQETGFFYWSIWEINGKNPLLSHSSNDYGLIKAPLLSEILATKEMIGKTVLYAGDQFWTLGTDFGGSYCNYDFDGPNPAEAAALLWIKSNED